MGMLQVEERYTLLSMVFGCKCGKSRMHLLPLQHDEKQKTVYPLIKHENQLFV
jgi:hypothetical protein